MCVSPAPRPLSAPPSMGRLDLGMACHHLLLAYSHVCFEVGLINASAAVAAVAAG